jgi:hypothetical protein
MSREATGKSVVSSFSEEGADAGRFKRKIECAKKLIS